MNSSSSPRPGVAALPGVPEVQHRRRGWRERSLWRYLMAAVVLAVLHLPFLFGEMPVAETETPPETQLPEVVSLPLPSRESGDGLAGFYGWLKLADPAQWYFPDDALGFAAANRPASRPAEPALPSYLPPKYLLADYVIEERRLHTPALSVQERSAALWRPLAGDLRSEPVAPSSFPQPNRSQVWRLADGRMLADPPVLDAEGLKALQEPAVREKLDGGPGDGGLLACGDGCTWLEACFGDVPDALLDASPAERRSRQPMPRIVVRQSCGVPALDSAALRALRHYLRNAYAGEKLPPAGAVLLYVSW